MCRCVGVWVGMWVHARRLTGGQPRRVRAGPDLGKIFQIRFQILCQILGRGHFFFENRSLVDFTGLLGVPGHPSSSGATDPILPTQRIPCDRDRILYTQRISYKESMKRLKHFPRCARPFVENLSEFLKNNR